GRAPSAKSNSCSSRSNFSHALIGTCTVRRWARRKSARDGVTWIRSRELRQFHSFSPPSPQFTTTGFIGLSIKRNASAADAKLSEKKSSSWLEPKPKFRRIGAFPFGGLSQ